MYKFIIYIIMIEKRKKINGLEETLVELYFDTDNVYNNIYLYMYSLTF